MPKKEPKKASSERGHMTKEEVYSHLDGLTEKGKAQYLDKILSRKGLLALETYNAVQESVDEIYGKMAVKAIEKGMFVSAGEFAEKARNEKLADEIYEKAAVEAVESGLLFFGRAGRFAERIKDKKLADEIYGKIVMEAAGKGRFSDAEKFAERIKDKKLADEIYGKAAVKAAGEEEFVYAGEFAEKAGKYLEQKHPDILADIYEQTGKVIKTKRLRKKLEAKGKKK